MVFVRVHLVKGRLSAEQKERLGAGLIQAASDVEGVVASQRHLEASWVQFIELEPENWYAPANLAGANPDSRIQLDIFTPQALLATSEEARRALDKANEAVRSVLEPGVLPTHGPWLLVRIIPFDQWAIDGRIPDWESYRAHLRADTPEHAEEALAIVYWPGHHAGNGLSALSGRAIRSTQIGAPSAESGLWTFTAEWVRLRAMPAAELNFDRLDGREAAARAAELQLLHDEVYSNDDDFSRRFRVHTRQPGFVLVAARSGGYLIGYAAGMPLRPSTSWWRQVTTTLPDQVTAEYPGRTFALVELLVRGSWRRRGIGRSLHDLILTGRPEERATVVVPPTATAAQAAFQNWGWHKVARASNRAGVPASDVLVTVVADGPESSRREF